MRWLSTRAGGAASLSNRMARLELLTAMREQA